MNSAYRQGFIQKCAEYGVDGLRLLEKVAAIYTPMYATQHRTGGLKENYGAFKNWLSGGSPRLNTSFSTFASGGDLVHDQASVSAPTLVDRVHGLWDGIRGRGNPYGTTDKGSAITPQQFDANVQNARMPASGWLRKVKPGEYDGTWKQNDDGSFTRGGTTSYPINGNALYRQMRGIGSGVNVQVR
jgi:hypothetical protein